MGRAAVQRRFAGLVAALLLTVAGSGCGSPVGTVGDSGCMPPPFSLSTDTARPGEPVTVSADDATCNPRYGADARIHLQLMDGSGVTVLDTTAAMNDAGGFSSVLTVPDSAVPGEGAVVAYPYELDWCDDTGRNNRVGAGIGIQRASCVQPSQPLTIKP